MWLYRVVQNKLLFSSFLVPFSFELSQKYSKKHPHSGNAWRDHSRGTFFGIGTNEFNSIVKMWVLINTLFCYDITVQSKKDRYDITVRRAMIFEILTTKTTIFHGNNLLAGSNTYICLSMVAVTYQIGLLRCSTAINRYKNASFVISIQFISIGLVIRNSFIVLLNLLSSLSSFINGRVMCTHPKRSNSCFSETGWRETNLPDIMISLYGKDLVCTKDHRDVVGGKNL